MNMGWHNTKIGKAETEFILCVLQCYQHNFLPQLTFKNPDFVIGSGSYMICRALNKFTFFIQSYSPVHILKGQNRATLVSKRIIYSKRLNRATYGVVCCLGHQTNSVSATVRVLFVTASRVLTTTILPPHEGCSPLLRIFTAVP